MKFALLLIGLLTVVFADNHLFRGADVNRDDQLSEHEFYTIFDHWDLNGDSKISLDEFSSGWLRDDWDDEELRIIDFHLLDINEDNYITDQPDLHHLFHVFDVNNNTFVSRHEFNDQWERLFED